MKKTASIFLAAILLSGCASTSHQWVNSYDGNQLTSGSVKTGFGGEYMSVSNNAAKWAGTYAGGEEKVQMRKDLLLGVGQQEIAKICGATGYQLTGEPNYSMQERSGTAYGGGLLGELIASAAASYENIPSEMRVEYKCN